MNTFLTLFYMIALTSTFAGAMDDTNKVYTNKEFLNLASHLLTGNTAVVLKDINITKLEKDKKPLLNTIIEVKQQVNTQYLKENISRVGYCQTALGFCAFLMTGLSTMMAYEESKKIYGHMPTLSREYISSGVAITLGIGAGVYFGNKGLTFVNNGLRHRTIVEKENANLSILKGSLEKQD